MGMRITDLGLSNARSGWISSGRTKVAEAEQAIGSGRQINLPSDNPSASARLLRHEVRLQRVTQYQRNAENARLWTATADQALQSASNNLGRAKTLAVQAGNDTLGPVANKALSADIRALADGMLTIANTKAAGRSLFAGTSDATDAYDPSGAYLGDAGAVRRSVDTNETIEIGGTGPDIFGAANPGDPMNGSVFEALHALADAVEADDNAQVRLGIEAIDVAASRVGSAQGRIGAIGQQLDAAEVRHGGERLAVEANVSAIRDTDIADAIIRLRSAEAGYEATLSATARGMSRSLLDFLR